ncbi:hypothetical protein L2E82_51389 [Cichorium intybus]|nr:hypothetical protein L2E82_51389 [Cichorium intybus]
MVIVEEVPPAVMVQMENRHNQQQQHQRKSSSRNWRREAVWVLKLPDNGDYSPRVMPRRSVVDSHRNESPYVRNDNFSGLSDVPVRDPLTVRLLHIGTAWKAVTTLSMTSSKSRDSKAMEINSQTGSQNLLMAY